MTNEVKKCIDMRKDFLSQYFVIPDNMREEVDQFIKSLEDLGAQCTTEAEFEERFMSEGYSDVYNGIYPRCAPKNKGIYDDSSVRDDDHESKPSRPGLLQTMAEEASETPDFELSDDNSLLKRMAEDASETPDFKLSDENSFLKRMAEDVSEADEEDEEDEKDSGKGGFFSWFRKKD